MIAGPILTRAARIIQARIVVSSITVSWDCYYGMTTRLSDSIQFSDREPIIKDMLKNMNADNVVELVIRKRNKRNVCPHCLGKFARIDVGGYIVYISVAQHLIDAYFWCEVQYALVPHKNIAPLTYELY